MAEGKATPTPRVPPAPHHLKGVGDLELSRCQPQRKDISWKSQSNRYLERYIVKNRETRETRENDMFGFNGLHMGRPQYKVEQPSVLVVSRPDSWPSTWGLQVALPGLQDFFFGSEMFSQFLFPRSFRYHLFHWLIESYLFPTPMVSSRVHLSIGLP